ncbi:hypothetical protein SMB34_06345 [Thalassospira permensis NBRC 106175]|uniref:Uncharacterized protein n=1 Tax=Thalassospira permensis NBRC 106175 TaxID=1353532 RepID=A0ABR4TM07_9PROT|nr:hypothetical protein SMB34_06345 [Thalassospira permensis NBRC 106175]
MFDGRKCFFGQFFEPSNNLVERRKPARFKLIFHLNASV